MSENQKRIFSVAYLSSYQGEIQRAYDEGDLEKAADLLKKMPRPSLQDFYREVSAGETEIQGAQYLRVQAEGWKAIAEKYREIGCTDEEDIGRIDEYEDIATLDNLREIVEIMRHPLG